MGATCLGVLEVENSQIPSPGPKANSPSQVAVSRLSLHQLRGAWEAKPEALKNRPVFEL